MGEHAVVYREYTKYLFEQWMRDPAYAVGQETFGMRFFQYAQYTPREGDTYTDIPLASLCTGPEPGVTLWGKDRDLYMGDCSVPFVKEYHVGGFILYIQRAVPLLVLCNMGGFPYRTKSLHLSCRNKPLLNTSHAYEDARCFAELVEEGKIAVPIGQGEREWRNNLRC